MDELEIKSPAQVDVAQLQEKYDSLRNLVGSLLVLMLVVSGTLNIFLWRQVRYTRRDLEAFRAQALPVINDYQTNSGPVMDNFVKKITEYGRDHPDFAPIMNKYGLKPTTLDNPFPCRTDVEPTRNCAEEVVVTEKTVFIRAVRRAITYLTSPSARTQCLYLRLLAELSTMKAS